MKTGSRNRKSPNTGEKGKIGRRHKNLAEIKFIQIIIICSESLLLLRRRMKNSREGL